MKLIWNIADNFHRAMNIDTGYILTDLHLKSCLKFMLCYGVFQGKRCVFHDDMESQL